MRKPSARNRPSRPSADSTVWSASSPSQAAAPIALPPAAVGWFARTRPPFCHSSPRANETTAPAVRDWRNGWSSPAASGIWSQRRRSSLTPSKELGTVCQIGSGTRRALADRTAYQARSRLTEHGPKNRPRAIAPAAAAPVRGAKELPGPGRDGPRLWRALLVPEGYAPFGEIVGRHLHVHPIADHHADAELAHTAFRLRNDDVLVLKLHAKHSVRQFLDHRPAEFQ